MVGNAGVVVGDSLKHSEGSKGPIEEPGMVGSGRDWSGLVGSGREVRSEFETVLSIPRALRVPIYRTARNGREWSGPTPDYSMTLWLFWARGSAGAWNVLRINLESTTLSLFAAGGSAGAWSVLRTVTFPLFSAGGRWRVERC